MLISAIDFYLRVLSVRNLRCFNWIDSGSPLAVESNSMV